MKEWLQKFKVIKGSQWLLLLLALCVLGSLYLPSIEQNGMSDEEKRVSAVLSQIAGAGEVQVVIYYAESKNGWSDATKTPVGAVIVARGAGDVGVRLNLTRAVQTLLGLPLGSIEVFAMEVQP